MSDTIVVTAYDPHWPRLFAETAGPLRAALGATALRIYHIGSTAVPGLDAKPVIDVQISVATLEPMDSYRGPLQGLGYEWRAWNDNLTRRFFREPPGQRRLHLHVTQIGSLAELLPLVFRDYLRVNPAAAQRYVALKHQLAAQYPTDRRAYTNAKGPLVWEVLGEATQWSERVGWEPGPSDA
jgi:GrpB-like predicted nucleotidyltransferase (UPF0157 family)